MPPAAVPQSERFTHNPYSRTDAKSPVATAPVNVAPPVFEVTTPSFKEVHFAVISDNRGGALVVQSVGADGRRATVARTPAGQLTMLCEACDAGSVEDFARVVAMLCAVFGMTSGGEQWCVGGSGLTPAVAPVPYCIGREAICVFDAATGLEVVSFGTRGRAGVYRTTTAHTDARGVAERVLVECGSASHPQMPLLREIAANAARGAMRLVGARVKWECDAAALCAAPTKMSVQELDAGSALAVAQPVIKLRVNPVRHA